MAYSTKIPEHRVPSQEAEENLHLRVETLQNCEAAAIDSTPSGGATSKSLATAGECTGAAAAAAARGKATHGILESPENDVVSYDAQSSRHFVCLPFVRTANSLYLCRTLEKYERRPYVHRG